MRRTAVALACTAAVLLGGIAPPTAAAAPVTVVDGPGRVHVEDDPFLPATRLPAPPPGAVASPPPRARAAASAARAAILRLYRAGRLDRYEAAFRIAQYDEARRVRDRLGGTRRSELSAVIAMVDSLAARGLLTLTRVEPLSLMLDRNRQFWPASPLPGSGERVRFRGSRVLFEYYPGQGLQLHPLANWGRANGLWQGGFDDGLRSLVEELMPLGVWRAGGFAWEYYFTFNGGRPPWVSGMAQGTALQALARASQRLDEPRFLRRALRSVRIFALPPPVGVRRGTRNGAHYLQYSFAPNLRIINAFVQSLVGLWDLATISGNAAVMALYRSGDAQARRELAFFDTGAWSLYSQYGEASLDYHKLARDFLANLCERTGTTAYCRAASNFTRYLREAPRVRMLTRAARRGRAGRLYFHLSKISTVGMTVQRGGRTVFETSATVSYGRHFYDWVAPERRGVYVVRLSARGPAGNTGRSAARLYVL